MPRRIYFLLPDVASSRAVVDELERVLEIPEQHIHVLGGRHADLSGLPQGGLLHSSDLIYGLALGAGLGSLAGLAGGYLAYSFPPAGVAMSSNAPLWIMTIAGTIIGLIVSALVAQHQPNHHIAVFLDALDRGEVLILVDVRRRQVEQTLNLIRAHHPQLEIGVTRPPKAIRETI